MSEMVDGCVMCGGVQPVTWMFTHLRPPATVQSCEEHGTENLIMLLATMVSVDYGWLYGVISEAVNAAADEHDQEQQAETEPEAAVDDEPAEREEIEPEPVAPVRRRPRRQVQPRPEMDAEVTDSAVEAG